MVLDSRNSTRLSINIKMDLLMSIKNIAENKPQRWITEINNGVVQLVQRIESDAVVISITELPSVCANAEIVSDEQARLIVSAIRSRGLYINLCHNRGR